MVWLVHGLIERIAVAAGGSIHQEATVLRAALVRREDTESDLVVVDYAVDEEGVHDVVANRHQDTDEGEDWHVEVLSPVSCSAVEGVVQAKEHLPH